MKKSVALLLCLCLLLSGCGSVKLPENMDRQTQDTTPVEAPTDGTEATQPQVDATIPEAVDMFTERDQRTEPEKNQAHISLTGTTATSDTDAVQISGNTVTVTDEGSYYISGELEGSLIVNAQNTDKLQLILENASIHNETGAAIYIAQADKVFITLADGTQNSLSSGESYVAIDENNIDAAVFSKDDLTFNGTGQLTVTSPAGHGITAKDDLVLTGGTFVIACASHGLQANDSIRIKDSSLTVTAGKDGMHCENDEDSTLGYVYLESGNFSITSEGDGISAGAWMQILDGTYNLTTGGGSVNGTKSSSDSYGGFMGGGHGGGMGRTQTVTTDTDSTSIKGIKAAGELKIAGGSFTVDSADDAIHSNLNITVSGGSFQLSTGDDGFHADEDLTMTGGTVNITESYEGLEGLDILITNGDITILSSDDGINAAGGTDSSGFGGGRGDMFGGRPGGMDSSSNGSISIQGGSIYMNASGDGIDANGTLEITGGYVVVCGPTQGDTAVLDYDSTAVITGGTFIGTGSSMMAQTFTKSNQGVIALSMGGTLPADTQITVTDSSGNVVLDFAPKLSFAIMIVSSPELVKGQTYSVHIGENSGEFEAY